MTDMHNSHKKDGRIYAAIDLKSFYASVECHERMLDPLETNLVVADIAKRLSIANPDSSDPLKEEAVILIDELDLHLHPKWQKEIAGDLKRTFPNCQFMISTHSPFIIQSLDAEEVFDVKTMTFGVSLDNEN